MNEHDAILNEEYFEWLISTIADHKEIQMYRGCYEILHSIPFYWTLWSDENRAADGQEIRVNEFLETHRADAERASQLWLDLWIKQGPSVLEVLVGIAKRFSFMFEEDPAAYFRDMFANLGLNEYRDPMSDSLEVQGTIRWICDRWMSRQYSSHGNGSIFRVDPTEDVNMREMPIWDQMNLYSRIHYQ